MSVFTDNLAALLSSKSTSIYKIATELGEEPSRFEKILLKKKPVSLKKRMEVINQISPFLGVDPHLLESWLIWDYFSVEAIQVLTQTD